MIKNILSILKTWAHELTNEIGSDGLYVFGSLIHRDGSQFNNKSDIDIVVCFPESAKTALDRLRWLKELHSRKAILESELATILNRPLDMPICSFVVPTTIELNANIHKDASAIFFTQNKFLNLITKTETIGIPGAGTKSISDDLGIMCFRFAQMKRNQYLAISANGNTNYQPFDETDPLPKDIMRHAAMAKQLSIPDAEPGLMFDIQIGLDFVTHGLLPLRSTDPYLTDINDRVSVRRLGRGEKKSLSQEDLIFLTEWIFDQAFEAIATKEKEAATMLTKLGAHSTVFFADRFAQAFPGIEGITWFDDPKDIKERLEILLAQPLDFEDISSPIWWWRGGNLPIKRMSHLSDSTFLMDFEELNIRKIAAVYSQSYYQNFVYVEAWPMPPTGLYDYTQYVDIPKCLLWGVIPVVFKNWLNKWAISKLAAKSQFGYLWEEYGLVENKHLVTRRELDDGAAKIDGKLQSIIGRTKPRTRYLTPYNFLIAAQMSPINNSMFDQELKKMMNGIISGDVKLEEIAMQIHKLPKSRF